jgi:alanyl-tRNA synthetase
MDAQRRRSRGSDGGLKVDGDVRAAASAFAGRAGFMTRFVGYETVEQATTVGAVEDRDGELLVKLAESPFYAAGGGQVSDSGVIECAEGGCRVRVAEVLRLGEDQAVVAVVESGQVHEGERVVARVDRQTRHATEANHTATHLLHAALRTELGPHVRQAGSYVGPDKLRFDFSHTQALSAKELRAVEDQVNAWILENHPVRPITTTLDEAKRLGAMALFGEKYGDVVRMVEIGDGEFSRELCGGTHVHSTAEIGVLRIVSETSSAANVRRIEALTGPEAVALLRRHDDALEDIAHTLRTTPEQAPEVVRAREEQRRELEKATRAGGGHSKVDVEELVERAEEIGDAHVLAQAVSAPDEQTLLALLDRLKPRLEPAAIVLGAATNGRAQFVASVSPALVERGVKAGEIVKAAATVTGGGGGGRDTMARAGGRDGEKLAEGLAAARAVIAATLG